MTDPEPHFLGELPPEPRPAGAEGPGAEGAEGADYESTPLSRQEYISAIVHLYRGELHRANSWRIRLDNTTNWAVLTVAGLLSLSFDTGRHSHWVLLIGMAIISVFWVFEARRFQMADVWRARVRKIEENFYGPILRRDPISPQRGWGEAVAAEELFRPHFKISRAVALRVRFARNYWAIYAVLLLAWVVHVLVRPSPAESWVDIRSHLSIGAFLPWWAPLAYIGSFFAVFVSLFLFTRSPYSEMEYWRVDPSRRSGDPIIDL